MNMQTDMVVHDPDQKEGNAMNPNPNHGSNRKEKKKNAITKAMSVAVLVALGLPMTAWAAEAPKGAGSDYEVSYQGKVVDELGQPLKDAKLGFVNK